MLKNKNAIVTGCNRGIGRVIVEEFAKNGANVWACARTPNAEFEAYLADLSAKHKVWLKPVYFDLCDAAALKSAVQNIFKEKLPVDILVNCAGVAHGGLLSMTTMEKLKEVFEVNYFSSVYLMQLVSKIMMKQKSGNIINIASVGGIETNAGYLAYGSSKAALIWATKSVSRELGKYNIRVNAVAPGLTKTQMGGYKNAEELEKTIQRTSLQRMAEPIEIANTVVFLASNVSSFVTGHILGVDGGR